MSYIVCKSGKNRQVGEVGQCHMFVITCTILLLISRARHRTVYGYGRQKYGRDRIKFWSIRYGDRNTRTVYRIVYLQTTYQALKNTLMLNPLQSSWNTVLTDCCDQAFCLLRGDRITAVTAVNGTVIYGHLKFETVRSRSQLSNAKKPTKKALLYV
ncbi:hypothetical protein BT96DRAFT_946282 [Gymnopus androsaceus JB14]|uniref:Uncharacterized protein n=1 Tax=Gymnopus androsaceus JB14 TaxID=1447944 RepID=A0A6A4GXR0_9AGAR|nr:hypothetical protein BT96DRAFT_946282 [Gymnopus androsaceus JB14]